MPRQNATKKYSKEFKQRVGENKDFTGIFINKNILFIDELSRTEKELLVLLHGFCVNGKEIYYSNSNTYLAQYLGVSTKRISQILNKLEYYLLIKIDRYITKDSFYAELTKKRDIYI